MDKELPIEFFVDTVDFEYPGNEYAIKEVLLQITEDYEFALTGLNVVFLCDEDLRNINKDFLNHDYYTDVITFDLSEEENEISGEIYISVDRVKDNAKYFESSYEDELNRVIIHGMLHLVGYSDKDEESYRVMKEKEQEYLKKLKEV